MKKVAVKAEPDWIRFHEQWKHSGLTQRDFCEQQGVSYYLFRSRYGELKKLERESLELSPSRGFQERFYPIAVEVEREFDSRGSQSGDGSVDAPEIEVELPFGVVLRFRGMVQS